ncbi:endo-1,4-beta-xylanase [Pontibacter sp. CAU 1760]
MKKAILLVLLLVSLGDYKVKAQNLLLNGDFESGTGNSFTNWWTQVSGGGQGAFTAETANAQEGSRAMKVSITQAGSAAYSIQAINDAWPSVTGTEYTLTFYAKAATAGKSIRVVQQTSTYASSDFALTTAWQKYTWTFTAQEAGLQLRLNFPEAGTFYLDNFSILGSTNEETPPPAPYTPTGPPIATGQPKFLGGVYSASQLPNFTHYFNQVVAENAGKWGSMEATRDVMNWSQLDAAYKLAKDNGFPFRMHVLIWGNQQPAWIENLPPAEQLEEIEEWFAAVAARYPAIDFLEVVNEPTNDPPVKQNATDQGSGNYLAALGGTGSTGWDWVIKAFQLARKHFPNTPLMINDYSVENTTANAQRYLGIINLLRERNLIDAIGIQGHAFSTRPTATATLKGNLDLFAATGLPIYITELDIDGRTDNMQLEEYKRIFPVFWEHPAVKGITLWGYRPGHWRTDQGAYLAHTNGGERAALKWLREYVQSNTNVQVPVITANQTLPLDAAVACNALGKITATDSDANTALQGWQVTGGTGASIFTLEAATGQVTITRPELIDFSRTAYTLTVKVNDGFNTSEAGTITIPIPDKIYVLHEGSLLHLDKGLVREHLAHGDCIGNNGGTVTGIGGTTADKMVHVYPNPATGGRFQLTLINFSMSKIAVAQVLNVDGRVLLEQELKQASTAFNQPLKPGLYMVRVIQNEAVWVRKIIIR